ncbi:hypothetical protein IMG5_179310 [Ichthyophthirius multifiliis]|uniref:Pep3/Vps18 beta-propeller domain-containing protein n=1 Tax=Ichthyophthirius multifiliis TaxID=5932 RepID=G0R2L1_ICHMU|nr:hypothetical protein IMG5_179310 [Ichthyophthirius multifiliis]EGR28275.1 hypothetical protein IMG5_179310 [Ichthyophthirius multifiliis]|eukprot:XP_004027620.1 hypothetical protein IMG5_179310 [Ichthyophthirius multifiliis]
MDNKDQDELYGFEEPVDDYSSLFEIKNVVLYNFQLPIMFLSLSRKTIIAITEENQLIRWKFDVGLSVYEQLKIPKIKDDRSLGGKIANVGGKIIPFGMLKKMQDDRKEEKIKQKQIEKIFQDTEGNHCIITNNYGDNYYLHYDSTEVIHMAEFKQIIMRAISFDDHVKLESSPLGIGITLFHYVILNSDSVTVMSQITEQVVFYKDLSQMGQVLGIINDIIMGFYDEAVETALQYNMIDIAKKYALIQEQKCINTHLTWMKKILQQTDNVKFEDLIPLFNNDMPLSQLNGKLEESLKGYQQNIKEMKEELDCINELIANQCPKCGPIIVQLAFTLYEEDSLLEI